MQGAQTWAGGEQDFSPQGPSQQEADHRCCCTCTPSCIKSDLSPATRDAQIRAGGAQDFSPPGTLAVGSRLRCCCTCAWRCIKSDLSATTGDAQTRARGVQDFSPQGPSRQKAAIAAAALAPRGT
ncbi:hypothetical protein NDU88_002169 [Pleurodeles waltl]|uniref:Uncharacterized protein n=1 Tax=Pleurodeles waltl TaxID=8319 RepID=A0AAV7W245_PLEWA|nr:hypothetical protein NDU88_002169 [Pleurodeles waltl]